MEFQERNRLRILHHHGYMLQDICVATDLLFCKLLSKVRVVILSLLKYLRLVCSYHRSLLFCRVRFFVDDEAVLVRAHRFDNGYSDEQNSRYFRKFLCNCLPEDCMPNPELQDSFLSLFCELHQLYHAHRHNSLMLWFFRILHILS